jgi:hypothetical protein
MGVKEEEEEEGGDVVGAIRGGVVVTPPLSSVILPSFLLSDRIFGLSFSPFGGVRFFFPFSSNSDHTTAEIQQYSCHPSIFQQRMLGKKQKTHRDIITEP